MAEVIEQIHVKKQRNKVEGRIPEMAAEDFISLNHLLKYQFSVTDIENCIIPYPESIPTTKPNSNLLRMKMRAKALKLKLKLN